MPASLLGSGCPRLGLNQKFRPGTVDRLGPLLSVASLGERTRRRRTSLTRVRRAE
jgi:hypothetical protein